MTPRPAMDFSPAGTWRDVLISVLAAPVRHEEHGATWEHFVPHAWGVDSTEQVAALRMEITARPAIREDAEGIIAELRARPYAYSEVDGSWQPHDCPGPQGSRI